VASGAMSLTFRRFPWQIGLGIPQDPHPIRNLPPHRVKAATSGSSQHTGSRAWCFLAYWFITSVLTSPS